MDASDNRNEYRNAAESEGVFLRRSFQTSPYYQDCPNTIHHPEPYRPSAHMMPLQVSIYHHQYSPHAASNVAFHGVRPLDVRDLPPPVLRNRGFQHSMPVPQIGPREMGRSSATYPGVLDVMYPMYYNPYGEARVGVSQGWDCPRVASNRGNGDRSSGPRNGLTSMSPGSSVPIFSDPFHSEPAPIVEVVGVSSVANPVAEQAYPCRLAKYSNQSGQGGTMTSQGESQYTSPFVSCGRGFTQPDHFITHVKKDHRIPNSKKSAEDVVCAWQGCNRTVTKGNYHRHIVEVHGGIPRDRSNEQKAPKAVLPLKAPCGSI